MFSMHPDSYKLMHCVGRGASSQVWLAHTACHCESTTADGAKTEDDDDDHDDVGEDRDARDTQSKNTMTVAVKKIALERFSDQFLERLKREVAVLRETNSEYIARLYCSFVVEGGTTSASASISAPLPPQLWIVMEACQGGSIADLMKWRYNVGASFSPGLGDMSCVATVARRVLCALMYLHKNGIVHRDVKSHNVLISNIGRVILSDLGCAYACSASEFSNESPCTTFCGTPAWIAPEVIETHLEDAATKEAAAAAATSPSTSLKEDASTQNEKQICRATSAKQRPGGYGAAADMWSFGILMHELVFGHAPYAHCSPMKAVLYTIRDEPPIPTAEQLAAESAQAMAPLFERTLCKRANKRATPEQLLQDCAVLQEKPTGTTNSFTAANTAPRSDGQEDFVASAFPDPMNGESPSVMEEQQKQQDLDVLPPLQTGDIDPKSTWLTRTVASLRHKRGKPQARDADYMRQALQLDALPPLHERCLQNEETQTAQTISNSSDEQINLN